MKYSNNLAKDIKQYNQVSIQTDVESAGPHRLIQMLMEGALEKITKAKGHMERAEIAAKGTNIKWAISIIDGLLMSLNKEAGGEIAENLEILYEYMQCTLVNANAENDIELLEEVSSLLITIKDGWDEIGSRTAHGTGNIVQEKVTEVVNFEP